MRVAASFSKKKKALIAEGFAFTWWTVGDSRIRCANPHPSLASSVGRFTKNVPLARFLNVKPPYRFESVRALSKIKTPGGPGVCNLAEEVGFEPTEPCGSTVFKTAAFNHSAIPP